MLKRGKKVKGIFTAEAGKLTGWEMAINRASGALARNKVQAARLRAAKRLFEQKLSTGEPWPGTQSVNQTHESATE
jgi:hypothetical protein